MKNLKPIIVVAVFIGAALAAFVSADYVPVAKYVMTDINGVVISHADIVLPSGASISGAVQRAALRYPIFNIPMSAFRKTEIVVSGVTNSFYAFAMAEEIQIRASTNNFESLVYAWCSDGEVGPTWAMDQADHDARLFFSIQDGSSSMALVEWDSSGHLTGQLAVGGVPGMMVLFQPSLSTQEGPSAWMTPGNTNLVWVYTLQTADGTIEHPNGGQMWNVIAPVEWREERVVLVTEEEE